MPGFLDGPALTLSAPVLQKAIVLMTESVSPNYSSENVVILTGGKKESYSGEKSVPAGEAGGAFLGQVLLTPGFEGRLEFHQRRLGKDIPDGGTSLNKGPEMGASGHWEGTTGWLLAIRKVATSQGMCIPVGMGALR